MVEGRMTRTGATYVTPGLSPKSETRAWDIAPLISLWAEGYSGVCRCCEKRRPMGSGVMWNPSALRMALIGRQKLYAYLNPSRQSPRRSRNVQEGE